MQLDRFVREKKGQNPFIRSRKFGILNEDKRSVNADKIVRT